MPSARVCLSYDFDAVTLWIAEPTKRSMGEFGAEIATPRLLDLHDRLDIPATWFVPGHTIESYPEVCGDIWDRGYDIQHHGWSHSDPREFPDAEAERADFDRAVEAIRELTERPPTGYRSPYNSFSAHTLDVLRDRGIEWDSSRMAHDFRPYYLREDADLSRHDPYEPGEDTSILEFPISENRTDWPRLHLEEPGVATRERELFGIWWDQFTWMYDYIDDGVFTLMMHPQVIGRAPRLTYLEELIRDMRSKPGVEFTTFDTIARERT